MINIIGKRYYFFALSFLFILPGLIVMAIWGLVLAIDFTGGTLLEVRFESGQPGGGVQQPQAALDLRQQHAGPVGREGGVDGGAAVDLLQDDGGVQESGNRRV